MARRKRKPTTSIGFKLARQAEQKETRRTSGGGGGTSTPATGTFTQQAKITFTDTRTGITSTRFEPITTTVTGGSGRGTDPRVQQAIIERIAEVQRQQTQKDAEARKKFLAAEQTKRKALEEQKQKEALARKRRAEILGQDKIKREQELIRRKLTQEVTSLGEIKGVFGETRAQRQIRGTLNALNKRVRDTESKRIADSISSIANRINQQQTITPIEAQQFTSIAIKRGNELTSTQIKLFKNIPKDVGLGVIDFSRDLKDFVVVVGRSPLQLVDVGKRLKIEADKQDVSVTTILRRRTVKGAKTAAQATKILLNNPDKAALAVGAVLSGGASSLNKDLKANPIRTITRVGLNLFPSIAIKSVKAVSKISKVVLKAADKAAFSPNQAVSIASKIADLETKKVKTRFDLQELNTLRQQLKVDQELKFITTVVDDINRVPTKAQGPLRKAQTGIQTKTNKAIAKGTAPKTGENKIKNLVNKQNDLTKRQKDRAFRKSKSKGVTPLTAETQAKRLAELFKEIQTTKINQQAQVKLTSPEISRINRLDRNINTLSKELKQLNKLLDRGVTDKTATRINQQKKQIIEDISKLTSFSKNTKNRLLKVSNVKDKLSLLKAVDISNEEISRLNSLRELQIVLSKLETKLGLDKSGLIEKSIKEGNIDIVELQSLTSKNFVKGLDLRNKVFQFSNKPKAEINDLIGKINKLLNAGSFKPTIKQKQRIIKAGKGLLFKEKTRKVPTILKQSFKKNEDLKGVSLDVIVLGDIVKARLIRIQEVIKGQRQTTITKSEISNILFKDTLKSKAIKKLKQIDTDIGKLKSIVRFLKEQSKDPSIPKRLRVLSLNEQGKNINVIKALEKDKIRILKALKEGVRPVDELQAARRQKLFAQKLKDEIERGKIREIRVSPPKSDPNDLSFRVNLGQGVQVEFAFNFPRLPRRSPLLRGKKGQASLGRFTKSQKPIAKVTFSKKTSIEKLAPTQFKKNLGKSIVNDPSIRSGIKKKSLLKQQRREYQDLRKLVKSPKTKNKIDVELKKINKLDKDLDNALRIALRVAALNRVAAFIKSETKTSLKVKPVTKTDLISRLKLTPVQRLRELVKEINKDISVVTVVKPLKPIKPVARKPSRVTKIIKVVKPIRPIKKVTKISKLVKPVPKKPKKIKLPSLTFDTPLPRGTRLKFDIKFRERRNASIPFNRFTNPIVVKTRPLGLPLNKAIKKGFGAIDSTTQASAQLFITGITKIKDIKTPTSLIKKFRSAKTKKALRFVERSKNRIDTAGEKRGLLVSKILKKAKRKTTKRKKKK